MSPRERSILTVTCFGHFISHFNMLVFPSCTVASCGPARYGHGPDPGPLFLDVPPFGLTALPWGLLADRFGSRPLLLLFHLGAGFCGFMAAMNASNPLLSSVSVLQGLDSSPVSITRWDLAG